MKADSGRIPVTWMDTTGQGGFPGVGHPHAMPGDVFRDKDGGFYKLSEELEWVSAAQIAAERDALRAEVKAHLTDPDFDAHHKAVHAERDALKAENKKLRERYIKLRQRITDIKDEAYRQGSLEARGGDR